MNAEDIIQAMARTYASCSTYRDRGRVLTRFMQPTGEVLDTSDRPFATAFVRPDRFRFEFKQQYPGRSEWHSIIVWQQAKEIRWWGHGKVERQDSLASAVAGATGISGGSGHTVPRLLLPGTVTGTCLTDMVNLRLLEDDTTDGVLCHRIECEYPPINIGPELEELLREQDEKLRRQFPDMPPRPRLCEKSPVSLWIDKDNLLLRRLEHRQKLDTFHTESVTTYSPSMNEVISERELEFSAPTTG